MLQKICYGRRKRNYYCFYGGRTVDSLAREYASTRTVKSDKTMKDIKMPLAEARKVVCMALTKINWGD